MVAILPWIVVSATPGVVMTAFGTSLTFLCLRPVQHVHQPGLYALVIGGPLEDLGVAQRAPGISPRANAPSC